MFMIKSRSAFLLAFIMLSFAQVRADSDKTEASSPFIQGYSPVSYFTKNIAEKGHPEFKVHHQGKTYYLTSAEQVQLFNQDPNKYRPRFDLCAYSLAFGAKAPLDPTNFKIVAGNLLLFHKSQHTDGLKLWNQSTEEEDILLERANKQYKLFEF